MNLSQRIAALSTERGQMTRAYEAALRPALDENRDLNDAETTTIDECRSRLTVIDQQIAHWTDAESYLARSGEPAAGSIPGNRPGQIVNLPAVRNHPNITMQRRDAFKGCEFTRMAIAVAVAGPWNAANYAAMRWGDDDFTEMVKGAVQTWIIRATVPPMWSGEAGGQGGSSFLVRFEQLQQEFIDMLRPLLIVGRLPNLRRLNFNNSGALLIPRQTGGVSGGYVGEGGPIVVNRLAFGQMTLTPSKLAVIVPQTAELLRRSDPSTEMLIRDDMLAGTAQTIDNVFFSTRVAIPNPAGILQGIGALAAGAIPAHDPDTAVVNTVTDALRAMIWALRSRNVPMLAPVWIMNARTKEYLRLLRTQQEIFAFKAEIDAGTLLGFPIIDTTSIPIPFPPGTGQQTAYALMDASQIIWADDMGAMIDASQDATIQLDDNPTTVPATVPPPATAPGGNASPPYWSAFQNDMIFMRLRMSHTWARRHDVAVAWALTAE